MTALPQAPVADPRENVPHVLVTGAEGLIGRALRRELTRAGWSVRGLDSRARGPEAGDIRDQTRVRAALRGVSGVVHLAAVSRVVVAQADPQVCLETNYEATRRLAVMAHAAGVRWFVLASSREVYGALQREHVDEDAPVRPLNVYGRSKAMAEDAVRALDSSGFRTAVVRFSSVFGGPGDHPTRVVPLFLRRAAEGAPLQVEGRSHTFDYTFVDEVVQGLAMLARRLGEGRATPPLHLVTGRGVSLWDLAHAARAATGSVSEIGLAPARTFDMDWFVGDPGRARRLLGWRHGERDLVELLALTWQRMSAAPRHPGPAGAGPPVSAGARLRRPAPGMNGPR